NGFSRSQAVIGPATVLEGFDGAQWVQQNGVLSVVSLPALVADGVTQAYLNSAAYFRSDERSTIVSGESATLGGRPAFVLELLPSGGSPADLTFDAATYRLERLVAHTAAGVDTTTYSNVQSVQGIPTAMRSVDVDPSGTTTTTTLTSVRYLTTLEPTALARPPYVSHGDLSAPVSVPFRSDLVGAIGHLVVPVTLGSELTTLVFDSGGADFLVPAAAQRLGLVTKGAVAMGGAGAKEQTAGFARVPNVDFGGAGLRNQNFIVTQLPYAIVHPRSGMTIDGLIGSEYLANYRIAVRYAAGRIEIAPFDAPAPLGGVTLPFKSDGAHAFIQASVDGVNGYFLLDTGNGGGVDLNGPFVQRHHLFAKGGLAYVSPGGVGGALPFTVAVAKSVQLAGVTFDDVPISVVHTTSGIFATRGIAGNFGARILSRFTVVFDYKSETVSFIPNADATAKFPSDGTGLSLNQTDPDAFEVLAVVADSPAAGAGIAAHDRIVAVNGTKLSSGLGLGDFVPLSAGTTPFTVTIERGAATKTFTIAPRNLLPPAQ
ncbi:MAG: aspartyl protease family protein, partial [Vulcanimicrobiaceae bacterium]